MSRRIGAVGTRIGSVVFLCGSVTPIAGCSRLEPASPLPPLTFQRGIHLATSMGAYSHPDGPQTVRRLREMNVEWIQMVPFAWQRDVSQPQLRYPDHTATQEAFIRMARRQGMRIMMKPHIWSPQFWGENGRWRGDVEMTNPGDWDRWFRDYQDFILHYAKLSERTGVELFCVGLEYRRATRQRPGSWRELIRRVREVYSGPLTYGAHYPAELEEVPFWDDLDYVGVILYPELTEVKRPDLEVLLRAWEPVAEKLQRFSAARGKPILIAEIGFNSIEGAARQPWRWARPGARIDLELQARLYEAAFRVLWDAPWVGGIYLWKWGIPLEGGGPDDLHYTPKGKPASDVMRAWFGRRRSAEVQPPTAGIAGGGT